MIEMLKKEIAQVAMSLQAQVAARTAAIHANKDTGGYDSAINSFNAELAALRGRLIDAQEAEHTRSASMLVGERFVIISEHGKTEHMSGRIQDCVYKHLHMLRVTSAMNVYAYDRNERSAYRFEGVRIEADKTMKWDHTHSEAYETLAQREASRAILFAPTTQTGTEYTQELGNGQTRKSRTRRFIWD